MGLLDFLFGNNEERVEPKSSYYERHLDEQCNTEKVDKTRPFVFRSNQHQRYENGNAVMGVQNCLRTVTLERNTSGCRGYNIVPGDGFIVKIYNDDLGKPLMSDKPMRIYKQSDNCIEFRGYVLEAQSPFGWQEIDYSDYSFVIYYNGGEIVKCVLNMLDRNVSIEYRLVSLL